jgi:starch synthase
MVVRLEEEKGVDLVVRAFPDLMARRLQFVLLGTGQEQYHTLFAGLAKQYPKQAHVVLRFDDALAHRIQAGADVFLMPSVFEPCGLSQLCALRYGAVPVVHETGGLADTVVDASPERLANGSATGFVFSPHNEEALLRAVDRALALFRKPAGWRNLMASGMGRDWSWSASARRYVGLYERAASRRREE